MKNWLKGGISGAVVLEVLFFVVAYWINRGMNEFVAGTAGKVSPLANVVGFPPDILQIIIILVFGFGVGALVGFLIKKYQ